MENIEMKKLSDISQDEWSELVVFVNKKVLGKTEYPHTIGLSNYRDEVITSLEHIRWGLNKKLRPSRLSPVLTEEYLPFFVVKWLQERGFLNSL